MSEVLNIIDIDEVHRVVLPAGFDRSNSLVISSTQVETFKLCPRKWWLRWPMHTDEPSRDYLDFGTALHAACERWLLADDRGTGSDLWPRGWCSGLPISQALVIQRLVTKAVESGVLVRWPGRLVEHDWLRELVEVDGITVFACGKIDVLLRDGVVDHKTTKDMKWAKGVKRGTENYLGDSTQMLMYARELLVALEERGELVPEHIHLRHNVFCKDPTALAVRSVDAYVTAQEVLDRWEALKQTAAEMVAIFRAHDDPTLWFEVQGPESTARACNAFGGCSYRLICGGRETVSAHQHRVSTAKKNEGN